VCQKDRCNSGLLNPWEKHEIHFIIDGIVTVESP
jgi:hypothetical protein